MDQLHFASIPSVEFEEIKPHISQVDVKIKAKEEAKNHKISKIRFELEKIADEKQDEEDLKEPTISDYQISTTHKMGGEIILL